MSHTSKLIEMLKLEMADCHDTLSSICKSMTLEDDGRVGRTQWGNMRFYEGRLKCASDLLQQITQAPSK